MRVSGPPARLLVIGWHAPAPGWHMPPHRHELHELVVLSRGSERVRTADGEQVATAGDILVFGPGIMHEEWHVGTEPLQSHFMVFESAAPVRWPAHTVDVEGRVRQLAGWMHALRDEIGPDAAAAAQAFLRGLLAEVRRLAAHQDAPLVAAVRGRVRRQPAAVVTLALLAEQAGLSKFHFLRRYRSLTGRSPMADVRLMRLALARDLLLTGSLPVKAIAAATGFGSERVLYRQFRRHFHTTPNRLRNGRGGTPFSLLTPAPSARD